MITTRQWIYLISAAAGLLLVLTPRKAWALPPAGEQYRDWLDQATAAFNLPPLLLHRVAYQESHFRPEIVSGKLRSSAGAVGIMQLVPRWHPSVDATNPKDSIFYAASYLYHLRQRFGSWAPALAAYNLGPTAVDKLDGVKGNQYHWWDLLAAPKETRDYVREILNDVKVT